MNKDNFKSIMMVTLLTAKAVRHMGMLMCMLLWGCALRSFLYLLGKTELERFSVQSGQNYVMRDRAYHEQIQYQDVTCLVPPLYEPSI